jgi:hypothetical protein
MPAWYKKPPFRDRQILATAAAAFDLLPDGSRYSIHRASPQARRMLAAIGQARRPRTKASGSPPPEIGAGPTARMQARFPRTSASHRLQPEAVDWR